MKSRLLAALLASVLCPLASTAQTSPSTAAPVEHTTNIPAIAPPVHPATEAQIREYFAINHALELSRKTMMELVHSQRAISPPYLTPGFWDDMETAVGQIDLVPLVVPAYQRYISEEDMAALIAFYKTPAGQRIVAAQPLMSAAISDAGRKAGQQAGLEVGKKHAAEIQRLMQQQKAPSGQPSIQVPDLSK